MRSFLDLPKRLDSAVLDFSDMVQLPAHEALRLVVTDFLENVRSGDVEGHDHLMISRIFPTQSAAQRALKSYRKILARYYKPKQVQSTIGQLSIQQDEDGWIIIAKDEDGDEGADAENDAL